MDANIIGEPYDSDEEHEMGSSNSPESHPVMQQVTSNWKLIGIISAFINRQILENVDLNKSITFDNKKPVISTNTGDPTILNVTNVDVYSLNLYRQVHQSFNSDIAYFIFN